MRKAALVLAMVFICLLPSVRMAHCQEGIPKSISIGTHPLGSFFNTIGTAAAKTLSDHTMMRAVPKPMAGPSAWFPYMERGDIELGVLNVWDAEKGYLGESVYGKLSGGEGFSIGLVCVTTHNLGGLVVPKDSPIKSIQDLKGKRVAGNFPTPSLQAQTEAYLINGNVKWSDVRPVAVNSVVEGVKVVMEDRADCSGTITLGMGILAELNAKKGARILPFDDSKEAEERMRKFHPGYFVKVAPSPENVGIEKEQYLWAYDVYLIAGNKLSEAAVYTVTKTLWENHQEFGKVHSLLKAWTPRTFISKEASIPYHPGAVKFYKEKGVWTSEMEELQQRLLKAKRKGG